MSDVSVGRIARVNCDEPAYDEDGVTLIGSCGYFMQQDTIERARQLALRLGWRLDGEDARCPFHAGRERARRKEMAAVQGGETEER